MKLRLFGPALVLLVASGCFATRNDVRILQEDILALRALEARSDSARARQLADISGTLNTTLVAVRDSVRELGTRLTTFQGATRQELYSLGQQLLQLGELMGQNQNTLRTFKAEIEERQRQAMQQLTQGVPPVAGDTARAVAAPPPVLTEGPNVLFQIASDQLTNRAWTSARDAFTKLINEHPTSDLVPDAYLGIANAFDAEGNRAQGDSVYRLVVEKYPSNQAAPRALYKLGMSLAAQKKMPEARKAMQDVVMLYPRSDEATLAADWLTRNPA